MVQAPLGPPTPPYFDPFGTTPAGAPGYPPNLYAQAYLDRTRASSRASMSATRDFLTSQVDSLGGELTAREEAVRAYMTREAPSGSTPPPTAS